MIYHPEIMPTMHLPSVIQELLELTGDTQKQLAKRLGVTQGTIHKWLEKGQQPKKPQWDKIQSLYFELKGWRHSLDAKIAPLSTEEQAAIHELVDLWIKNINRPRRR